MHRPVQCLRRQKSRGHYCKIKILHQHRLTFPSWVPVPKAKISEKPGFVSSFSAFHPALFLRICQKVEDSCWRANTWSDVKNKEARHHRGHLSTGCLVLLVLCFSLFCAPGHSLVKAVGSQLACTPPGTIQYRCYLCTCLSSSNCFVFVKEFPVWVRILESYSLFLSYYYDFCFLVICSLSCNVEMNVLEDREKGNGKMNLIIL